MRPYLEETKKGLEEWLKVGPEFKPQHCKRKKKKSWTYPQAYYPSSHRVGINVDTMATSASCQRGPCISKCSPRHQQPHLGLLWPDLPFGKFPGHFAE
jgi:hypothetical protein